MLNPITFKELAELLEHFDILPDSHQFEGARVFRAYRMGVAQADMFYAVAYDGDDTEIPPPTQRKLMVHFDIPLDDWLHPGVETGSDSASGREEAE